eukprot:CAMPEP_0198367650 /NCGR_PEP_ID=MMETSP1450-20131203/155294_1 /TAXON_ID=753684 ORGANISM="Madagascaria erythrocladiodes, Strain CCMP3234" /NCGR_SAMPLE_ID=MMETSP1450 /ASSEMBLY_ACC=CAM_ASM_001115 /LENGTH=140 /DNA_ID=CAMNT_0044075135 /DNA_START=95 /DNA_END=517 /DNA_ORIENTATION=-
MEAFVGNVSTLGLGGSRRRGVCNRSRGVVRMQWGTTVAQDVEVKVTEKKRCKQIAATEGDNLRKVLKDSGVDIYTLGGKLRNCGGGGTCGTCVVEITEGFYNCNPRTVNEERLLSGKPDNYRLACRTTVSGPVSVRTKPE